MPTPIVDNLVVESFDYDGMVKWFKDYYNLTDQNIADWVRVSNEYGISDIAAVEDLLSERVEFFKTADGKYNVTGYDTAAQWTNTNPLDSNLTTIERGGFKQMLNRAKDTVTDKFNITRFPASGSFGDKASYLLGSVGSAFTAASVGIALGKTIDSVLYNVNPDFWDSVGMSSLNPDTWDSITVGDDSVAAGLFNMILGLNPDTGQSQMYIDQNALAYMAYWMKTQGVFSDSAGYISDFTYTSPYISEPFVVSATNSTIFTYIGGPDGQETIKTQDMYPAFTSTNDYKMATFVIGSTPIGSLRFYSIIASATENSRLNRNFTYNGKRVYYTGSSYDTQSSRQFKAAIDPINIMTGTVWNVSTSDANQIAWTIIFGDSIEPIEGIGTQPGATLPDTNTWEDIPTTLQSLQNTYPDMWNNALTWDNVQPDGTNPQLVYVPVPMPDAVSGVNPYPTSGTQTQTDTLINPETFPKELTKILTQILQNPQPKTDTSIQPITPPQNPIDTGTGGTITPIAPTGNASALWSVYHPSQAQVNQFGGWLWSADIITQIQQVLQNPMEGIITLHKVFVSPIDSGNGTIVVGRLDSEVPSATVTQQYVEVDCGTIDCFEYFGNVFDYAPYTNVSLYLPFIGIVPLDVSDVMRSTVNVIYRVDVFTGACLAMVIISRDGNTINLYQYSGVASVEYPLTGQTHSGLISGLLGIAGGVAGLAMSATGAGAIAGIGAIAGGLVNANKSNFARASGFSGSSGAMGIKTPYLILQRPQTKVADYFAGLRGYVTNYSNKLGAFSGNVVVSDVHVSGINATDNELQQIESILRSGVIV